MLLKFFKQSLPQVIIAIILISVLLWLRSFLSNQQGYFYFDSIQMPLYSLLASWISNNVLLGRIITFVALLVTGFYLLQINSKHIVIKQRTYLLSFFYLIIMSSLISLQQINPAVFAAFFFVFALDHILSIYHKEVVLDNLFRAGFYIAIASLFYAPVIFYIIAGLLSIVSIRTFNLREWFALLFGLITPWFFYFFYHYFVNSDLMAVINILNINLLTEINHDIGAFHYIFYSYNLILFIVTGLYIVRTISSEKISVRKFHGVFFWFNLVSILIIVIIPTVSYELLYLALVPITFQFTHYFGTSNRRFWPNFLFFMVLALSILMLFYSNSI